MGELRESGCKLLILPEFACAQWLSFAPTGLALTDQVAWLAQVATDARGLLSPLAEKHDMALLPGTMPFEFSTRRYTNRAWLFLPDGSEYAQDKLCLTPSERNPRGWMLEPGTELRIICWQGYRLAICICLDIEFTALWRKLGKLDIDFVIVPAKTDKISGYNRVFACAYARAIELQTLVCVVGAIGSPYGNPAYDTVMGGASIYAPPDEGINPTGIIAALAPHVAADGLSPLLFVPDVPIQAVRLARHGAAEAEIWPSSWPADHIQIMDPAAI
jgi:predicted amidohydrolase